MVVVFDTSTGKGLENMEIPEMKLCLKVVRKFVSS